MDGLFQFLQVLLKVAIQNNVELIFYGEDGEVEYGGSTKNKNKPFFNINYMIKNYFEGDYELILNKSGLKRHQLYWFDLIEENKSKLNKIKLTHWGYFEPWDSIEIIYFQKKSMILKKVIVQTKVLSLILLKMIKHYLLYICI